MMKVLDHIPYVALVIVAVLLLLAPLRPMPHVIEKFIMLKNGNLTKPIDIFDLIFHLAPSMILVLKILRDMTVK